MTIDDSDLRGVDVSDPAKVSELMALASKLRDSTYGNVVTYSRKVFLPLTNMCRNTCKYCTFVQHPSRPSASYMTPEMVLATARQGEQAGCREALFSLGENPESRYPEAKEMLRKLGYETTIDYLDAMCRLVVAETSLVPHVNAGAITEGALAQLKDCSASMGMMLESISKNLLRKGMAHHACPDKAPKMRLRTVEAAGRLKIPFTTGVLIGIGETWQERIDSLIAIRDAHLKHGHIQEVIVQNFRAKKGIEAEDWPEPHVNEMLATLAAARLILPTGVSLQAPPNLADDALAYLDAGINDWGGISPVTKDFINPERKWPHIEELRIAMKKKGFQLVERLTVYPDYLDAEGFVTTRMYQHISEHGHTNLGLVS